MGEIQIFQIEKSRKRVRRGEIARIRRRASIDRNQQSPKTGAPTEQKESSQPKLQELKRLQNHVCHIL